MNRGADRWVQTVADRYFILFSEPLLVLQRGCRPLFLFGRLNFDTPRFYHCLCWRLYEKNGRARSRRLILYVFVLTFIWEKWSRAFATPNFICVCIVDIVSRQPCRDNPICGKRHNRAQWTRALVHFALLCLFPQVGLSLHGCRDTISTCIDVSRAFATPTFICVCIDVYMRKNGERLTGPAASRSSSMNVGADCSYFYVASLL